MNLTPELIEYCKTELQIKNNFVSSEKVTASHELFESWRSATGMYNLPKLIFYIIMNEEFGEATEVDEKGSLGRKLQVLHTKTTDNG